MNVSTPKNLESSNSNTSQSQIRRFSFLRPPGSDNKTPSFLQITKVSLNIPKHDNDLPDYTNSPILLNDEQRSVRSLGHLSSNMIEAPIQPLSASSPNKPSLMRKETLIPKSPKRLSIFSSGRGRNSTSEQIDIFQENKVKKREKRYVRIEKFLNNQWLNFYLIFITLYALFGQDFCVLVIPKDGQIVFDIIGIISIISFFIEIVLNFIAYPDYRWSFFFFLDFISTLSMLLDLSFINFAAIENQANSTQIVRASRVSKVGARAGRAVGTLGIGRVSTIHRQGKSETNVGSHSAQQNHLYPAPSLQSLTNLVDAIAKLKKQERPSQTTTRRFSIDVRKMMTWRGNDRAADTEGEYAPLADQSRIRGSRRTSQFAITRQISDNKEAIPLQNKMTTMKTLRKALTLKPKNPHSRDIINDLPKESRVGRQLSDATTMKIILVVIILLLIVPMFGTETWLNTNRSYRADMQFLQILYDNGAAQKDIDSMLHDIVERHEEIGITPILYLRAPNGTVVYESNPPYTSKPIGATEVIGDENGQGLLLVADLTKFVQVGALTNISKTIFVCIVFTFGSWIISKDINNLILRPLERMIDKINRIAVAPLSVKREYLMEDKTNKETVLLENAITKIGALLALGFGEAGAGIIAQNIAFTGDMNPMILGEKIMAIFGFCDIRNFTDATEVLQEEVMVFVNSIAEIVHDKVDKYGGSANKNIGDAFLLVWKFPNSEVEEMDEELQLKNSSLVNGLADFALFSFLKIFAKVNQSHVLRKYRSNAKMLERLPNYKVKMGFGLHVGWGIEGAIGSDFKIDASYLSPNVNIASRLEAATKQYGVPLLISSDVVNILSEDVQHFCRKIDVVTVKGSTVPLKLYTVDLDPTDLRDKGPSKRSKRERVSRHEMKKSRMMEMIWEGKLSTHLLFEKDRDIRIMMKSGMDEEMKKLWNEGIEAYIEGEWKNARLIFDKYLVMRENDGPSETLLQYMRTHGYKASEDWKGYRELTEK